MVTVDVVIVALTGLLLRIDRVSGHGVHQLPCQHHIIVNNVKEAVLTRPFFSLQVLQHGGVACPFRRWYIDQEIR